MTGSGEWQFVLFALAIGLSEVASGLVATIPVLAGAILQVLTPWGVRKSGSIRRWVWINAAIQAGMLGVLSVAAFNGGLPGWGLYLVIAGYWASGYMTGPPWTAWVTSLVPSGVRATFWVNRSRWIQGALGLGLGAGLVLQWGESAGMPLVAFGVVFALAALARTISSICLANQSEAEPGLLEKIETPSRASLSRHFADRRIRGLLLYMLAFFLSVFVAAPFIGPYLREQLHFEYWQIMVISGSPFLVKVLLLPMIGRLVNSRGPARVLWMGALTLVPTGALWAVSESFWWLLAIQLSVGFGWACWETGSFLLVFDVIPAEKRTPVMTMYQLALALVMVGGSLIGGGVLEWVGVNMTGYLAMFICTSLMRFMALFLLASLEPSGFRIRNRVWRLTGRSLGLLPGVGSAGVGESPDQDDISRRG